MPRKTTAERIDGFGEHVGVKKMRGRWQAVVYFYQLADVADGPAPSRPRKEWHTITKLLDVPSHAGNNRGKATAEREAVAWFESLKAGTDERTAPRVGTVGAYVRAAIDGKEKSGAIATHTVDSYRRYARYIDGGDFKNGHIDGIGGTRVEKLTRPEVQSWVNQMAAHYAPVTVRQSLMVLRDIGLKAAYLDGAIQRNPADNVSVSKVRVKEPNYLNAAQRAQLLDALDARIPNRRNVAIELALLAGLRQGEVSGLMWRDVDTETGSISVRQVVARKGNGFVRKDSPKNSASRRTIPITGRLLRDLRMLFAQALEWHEANGIPFSPSQYVVGRQDGRWLSPRMIWKHWRRTADALGLVGSQGRAVKFHDLRHTFATAAIESGADVKSVASLMGHANAAMTLNTYASADPDAKRRAMERVAEAMEAAPRPAPVYRLDPTGTEGAR